MVPTWGVVNGPCPDPHDGSPAGQHKSKRCVCFCYYEYTHVGAQNIFRTQKYSAQPSDHEYALPSLPVTVTVAAVSSCPRAWMPSLIVNRARIPSLISHRFFAPGAQSVFFVVYTRMRSTIGSTGPRRSGGHGNMHAFSWVFQVKIAHTWLTPDNPRPELLVSASHGGVNACH